MLKRYLKPKKRKVILTFVDTPSKGMINSYFANAEIKRTLKNALRIDKGIKNLKIKVT